MRPLIVCLDYLTVFGRPCGQLGLAWCSAHDDDPTYADIGYGAKDFDEDAEPDYGF
ncbi:MAG TPA: hypothetical protein VM659_01475 [Dongiaceae bacterium]|nr:hypothetical protein [Dongiaceae bacterium]